MSKIALVFRREKGVQIRSWTLLFRRVVIIRRVEFEVIQMVHVYTVIEDSGRDEIVEWESRKYG